MTTTPDTRPPFNEALRPMLETVAGLQGSQLEQRTPCDAFNVRDLLGHLLMVVRRVGVIGQGGNPMEVSDTAEHVADDAWTGLFTAEIANTKQIWSDPTTLDIPVVLPWITTNGAGVLGMYANEVLVHTWDIAKATGQTPVWPESSVDLAFESMQEQLPKVGRMASYDAAREYMPEDQRDFPPPFLEVVELSGTEAPIDRLVAWNGRHPGWSAA